MEIIAEFGVTRLELSKLRMQALDIVARGSQPVYKVFDIADQIVHYCLTGEHQLPEKKE